MADSLIIPQHDRRPAVRCELKDGETAPDGSFTGYAVVLAGSDTVYFLMRPVADLANPLRVAATVVSLGVASTGPDDPGTPAVVEWQPATSGAPAAWGSVGNHHTGAVGTYDQEWEVQDASGKPMTFPTDAPNTITIRDDIDYP